MHTAVSAVHSISNYAKCDCVLMIICYCTIMIIFNLCRVLLLLQVVIKPQAAHGVAHLVMPDLVITPSSSLYFALDINGIHPTDLQLHVPGSAQSSNKAANTIAIDSTLAQSIHDYFSARLCAPENQCMHSTHMCTK